MKSYEYVFKDEYTYSTHHDIDTIKFRLQHFFSQTDTNAKLNIKGHFTTPYSFTAVARELPFRVYLEAECALQQLGEGTTLTVKFSPLASIMCCLFAVIFTAVFTIVSKNYYYLLIFPPVLFLTLNTVVAAKQEVLEALKKVLLYK